MENTKRIIEINGIKMEVDLRDAKVIENFKVGDTVKILTKDSYGNGYKSSIGIIVGFDEFKKLPTIVVCYISNDYGSMDLKFAYINSESENVELCMAQSWDINYTEADVIAKMNNAIETKQAELKTLIRKKEIFQEQFGHIFKK